MVGGTGETTLDKIKESFFSSKQHDAVFVLVSWTIFMTCNRENGTPAIDTVYLLACYRTI